jgi:hypothetical protein
MPTEDLKRRLAAIRRLLEEKGFEEVQASHFDNTPARRVVLQDGTGRVAAGDDDRVARLIEGSDDVDRLWSALEEAGMVEGSHARQS